MLELTPVFRFWYEHAFSKELRHRNGKGLTILGWDMKKQGNLLVWIRFWLQENSSVNQTQIIIISYFFFLMADPGDVGPRAGVLYGTKHLLSY